MGGSLPIARSLAGGRFDGNGQTLADFRPPGPSLGDKTLRDGKRGLATIVSVASAWARPAEVRTRVAFVHDF